MTGRMPKQQDAFSERTSLQCLTSAYKAALAEDDYIAIDDIIGYANKYDLLQWPPPKRTNVSPSHCSKPIGGNQHA